MKKSYLLFGVIFALVIIMVVTNPKQEEYVNWATNQLTEDKGLLVSIGADQLAKPVINSSTKTTNYLLFSLYRTSSPHKDEISTTIGLFNYFISTK